MNSGSIFVLQNKGAYPIFLYERWNSWGARQWRIRVSDGASQMRWYVNPQFEWEWNNPSTFELKPGKEWIYHCVLSNKEYRTWGTGQVDGIQVFVSENSKNGRDSDVVDWQSPVTLVGFFSSMPTESDVHSAEEAIRYLRGVIFPSWGGIIETAPVKIDLPARINRNKPKRKIHLGE